MITTNSNCTKVIEFLGAHKSQLRSHDAKANIQWGKLERQSKGKNTSMFYEYELDGITCWHLRHGNGHLFHYSNLIVIPFANDKYQYIDWSSKGTYHFKYTSHFFDRYKERMNVKGSVKQCVKQFSKKSTSMVCIYRKNGQFVYCMDDGLVLGVEDEQLKLSVCCTFVSYDLLKYSQRSAFNKIQDIVGEIRKAHVELYKHGVSHENSTIVVEERFKNVSEAAAKIYSWYFETGDLKERN